MKKKEKRRRDQEERRMEFIGGRCQAYEEARLDAVSGVPALPASQVSDT
jgi:hypothetical protein